MIKNFITMKQLKYTFLLVLCFSIHIQAQNQSALVAHYKAFYAQMQQQGDIQGVINAMTMVRGGGEANCLESSSRNRVGRNRSSLLPTPAGG